MKKKILLLVLSTTLLLLGVLYFSPFDPEEDEDNISAFEISGKKFTLPSPIHSFLYLSEQGFNWLELTEEDPVKDYKLQSQIALHLGLRASDGVVHLFNKEFLKAKKDREDVLHYSGKLGLTHDIRKAVAELDLAFIKGSDRDDLINAILKIEVQLENSLKKKGRDDLSLLIELGSWLGGLELVTKGIRREFKEEYCYVLRQSHITELSIEIIKAVRDKTKDEKEIQFLDGLLKRFEDLHLLVDSFDTEVVTQKSLNDLFELSKSTRLYLENYD